MSAPALYHLAEKIVGDLTYQADEISLFCQQVLKMEVNRHMPLNGLFLSSLINNCPESVVHLRLGENGSKIDYLGYRNQRELFIQGDAGSYVGQGMQAGQIKISGTAKGLGRVRGGTIYSGDKLLYPRGLSKIKTAFRWLWQRLNKSLSGFGRK
jgi:formylmethanofuran dehydrogenase subunit C